MQFESIQEAIDHSINVVTTSAVNMELDILRQEGVLIQDLDQIKVLAMDMREEVQLMLEASN